MNAYGEELYNGKQIFSPLQGEEKYRTQGFLELALIYGSCEQSYRDTARLINRVRYQLEEGTPARTVRDNTEKEGRHIQEYLEAKTGAILEAHGFSAQGVPPETTVNEMIEKGTEVSLQALGELVEDCHQVEESLRAEILKNPVAYEDQERAVYISIDEVGAKKQKETRLKNPDASTASKKREYVQNTVVHVQKDNACYILNGCGVLEVLRMLLAFLLHNQLGSSPLVFFVDGNSLYLSVVQFFAWRSQINIILDWYHLKKKCKELLSMACKSSQIRNSVLQSLLPFLWHGLVEKAVDYLNQLPECQIKNQEELAHLIRYLEKNRPMIPAYEIRCCLGLRNSSNRGEKANDLIVAERQKHNGMSWSKQGSVALATVTALKKNQEYQSWFQEETIEFKLAA